MTKVTSLSHQLIKDATIIGYTALEMGFGRAKPIRSYLKEHGKVFPIL